MMSIVVAEAVWKLSAESLEKENQMHLSTVLHKEKEDSSYLPAQLF